MKRNWCILFYILLIVSNMACQKYLDARPDSTVTTPETLDDLQALLDEAGHMNEKGLTFGEASADDYFLTENNYNVIGINGQNAYIWSIGQYEYTNDWAKAYLVVHNANVCLEALSQIKRTDENGVKWDNVKGSASFYKAHSFLRLAWIHANAYDESTATGDYGIVLRLDSDFNTPSSRANLKESYEQIIRDLEDAATYLPDLPQHVMRPSKAAAFALLGRTYLSMRKYDMAFQFADKCLKIKDDLMDYNNIDSTSLSPFQSFNKEVIFHNIVTTFSFFNVHPSYSLVDTMLYASFGDNDLRKHIFFAPVGNYHKFKGAYGRSATSNTAMFTGIATDELYLIRAECLARMEDTRGALEDLNKLMEKRWDNSVPFNNFTSADKEEVLERILLERRKELLFRDLRWIDIKRLNKEGAEIVLRRLINGKEHILLPNDNRYALPIPTDIISISGIPQNPD